MLTFTAPDEAYAPQDLDGLIRLIAAGNREALEELYTRTRSSVYGFALSIAKSAHDAEDVLQETYIRVWSSAASYAAKGTPMAWLLAIAKNLALMKLRARGKSHNLEPEEWAAIAVPDSASNVHDRHLLEAALAILSDDERQIIMLHAVAGVKHREISSLLDIPLPTVLSKYHRALKKLRTYLEGADAND